MAARATKKKPGPNVVKTRSRERAQDDHVDVGRRRDGKKRQPRKVVRFKSGGGQVRITEKQVRIIEGEENLDDWTIEELIEGRRGKGRPPTVIPIVIHQELARRVITEARHQYVANLGYAVEKHMAIIRGIEMEERQVPGGKKGEKEWVAVDVTPVQLKAILALEDRVMGQPREQVDVNIAVEKPYEKLMASAIVPNKAALEELEQEQAKAEPGEEEIIEGELVDDLEDSED